MAKGLGYMMAYVAGTMEVSQLRDVVIACPICGGPMKIGTMTKQFKCSSESSEDMPDWLKEVLEKQGFESWAYYKQDGGCWDFLMQSANGVFLNPMNVSGRFGGWQWDGIPEGEIEFPDWFPVEKRDEYINARFETWKIELEELKQHPDCGELEENHPKLMIQTAKYHIERAENARKEQVKKDAKRQVDQEALNKDLSQKGFFDGRLGSARLPEGAIVFSSKSFGDKSDPMILASSPKIQLNQLEGLVRAKGDYSEVKWQGRFPVIYSPNPGNWIGSGGSKIKALAQALGLRFIKVEKK